MAPGPTQHKHQRGALDHRSQDKFIFKGVITATNALDQVQAPCVEECDDDDDDDGFCVPCGTGDRKF